jgi:hypothetical protein
LVYTTVLAVDSEEGDKAPTGMKRCGTKGRRGKKDGQRMSASSPERRYEPLKILVRV